MHFGDCPRINPRHYPRITIDRETAIDLLHRLARFLSTEEGDVKRLTDIDPPEFRLRLGDYRLRFYDHGDWIEVLRVRNRKDAYR